jgi:hypothetical protein
MDRETVITHLQIIHTWAEFARERDLQFFTAKHLDDIAKWADDAIALLKEQKAETIECEMCGHRLQKNWNWCPWCRWETAGRSVKCK